MVIKNNFVLFIILIKILIIFINNSLQLPYFLVYNFITEISIT